MRHERQFVPAQNSFLVVPISQWPGSSNNDMAFVHLRRFELLPKPPSERPTHGD
jgi:hypothetical protein